MTMQTPIAPPPATPASGEPPQPPTRRTSSWIVSISVAVIGGLVVVGTLATVALGVVAVANRQHDAGSVPVADVTGLDLEVAGGQLVVSYGDVPDAQLTVDRGLGSLPWTFENDGGTLKVASPDHFGGFGWPFGGNGTATLTLPSSMQQTDVDAVVAVSGGSVSLSGGRFDDLEAVTEAGSLRLSGIARTLSARSDAGSATLDLANVETAKLDVSAGRTVAELGGTVPKSVDATVSAGALDLTVPAGTYFVTSSVSAGAFHNSVGSTSGATNTITADVSAGAMTLSAAD